MNKIVHLLLVVVLYFACPAVGAQNQPQPGDSPDLAKKTQNPVSDLISVPLQSNFNFGAGPGNDLQYLFNLQPVYPMRISQGWNLIHRPIIPLLYQPQLAPGVGDKFGLSDIQYQMFFSPAKPSRFIWGVGPVFSLPSATDESLGSEKWSAGPVAVVLTMRGPWVVGGLINNLWSFAGDDNRLPVNQMTAQPFLNYNFRKGWYLTSSPIITSNWEAASADRWTVPVGGGGGRTFVMGRQPVNVQLQAFWNAERPSGAADWSLRFTFQLLFPK